MKNLLYFDEAARPERSRSFECPSALVFKRQHSADRLFDLLLASRRSMETGGANNTKIVQLAERLLKRIWVFKPPRGMKGSIQLLGSLLVSDEPSVAVVSDFANVIYYDPFSPESVMFTDSDTSERIEAVSAYFQYRFHSAFAANFTGDAGVQAMEANVVRGLEVPVSDWETCQMLERVGDRKKVQPINPFERRAR